MSFPRYPKYKDSGVDWLGKVPAHWDVRRLGYFFTERREKVSDIEHPPLSVTKNGVVPQLETAAKTDDNENRKRVCIGDFVINSRSDRKGSAGISELAGSVSLINTVLVPHEGAYGAFVHLLLRSYPFQEEFYRFGKGIVADLWSTNFSDMRNIVLAMPPIHEQELLAKILAEQLSKIEALIAEQRRLVELLNEKRQAVIARAVTKGLNVDASMKPSGVDWLGELPAHWTTPPVFLRYEVALGKMLDEKRNRGHNPIPYLRNADVNWDRICVADLPEMDISPDELERYTLRRGDLLICEGGAGVGQTAIWQGWFHQCAFQKALHRLRSHSERENPRFMYYLMRFSVESGAALATGNTSTIPHLTNEKLRSLRLPCPPREEQDAIVSWLDTQMSKIDGLTKEAERAVSLLKERRDALLSDAVTGKIDIRGLVDAKAA